MLNPHDVLRDRYQLQRKLGQTAGRQTWLALDQASQPSVPVIIKLLAFVDQVNWDTLRLFEREAAILQQLRHPAIPQYRDYFSIDDRVLWFGLVQDYIPGDSLSDLIRQGRRFSLAQVEQIAVDLLNILIHLHTLTPPVFHRDIKPSNLILDERDRIFLIDFGSVQDRVAVEGSTFTVVGTYGYAPMEQFGGRTVAASDLYSLGATLIHLLTGVCPADLPQDNLQIQFADRVNLPSNWVRWLQTMTHPDVTQRFASAQIALNALPQTRHSTYASAQASRKWSGAQSDLNWLQQRLRSGDQAWAHLQQAAPESQDTLTARSFSQSPDSSLVQSQFSRVKIAESPESLIIEIAHEYSAYSAAIAIGGVAIFSAGLLLTIAVKFPIIPLLILGIIVLCWAWESGSTTQVVFDRHTFSIYRDPPAWIRNQSSWLGRAFSTTCTAQHRISEIQDVIQHDMLFAQGKSQTVRRVVTLQTQTEDISFGKGLNRSECLWIAQRIRQWIGLR